MIATMNAVSEKMCYKTAAKPSGFQDYLVLSSIISRTRRRSKNNKIWWPHSFTTKTGGIVGQVLNERGKLFYGLKGGDLGVNNKLAHIFFWEVKGDGKMSLKFRQRTEISLRTWKIF